VNAATDRYLTAHEALWRSSADEFAAGIDWETDDFLRLNRAAEAAAEGMPRWRQRVLDRRLVRKLKREGFGFCRCGSALLGPGQSHPGVCE
jgi:hypothetical protein